MQAAVAQEQEQNVAAMLKKDEAAKKAEEKMLHEELALAAHKQSLVDNARTQSLADDTWSSGDGTFQVDGSHWGPSSGDWA